MWYSTDYHWILEFSDETTLRDVQRISSLIDDNNRWDLELTKWMDGIQWNWCEKTYDLEEWVNIILSTIKQSNPKFDLIWEFQFAWEDIDDRGVFKKWDDWLFKRFMHIPAWKKICCPHCGNEFYYEENDID